MRQCSDWQERVALFAGGDLLPSDAAEVETHLGHCAACAAFACELRGDLDALRAEHQAILAPEHYVQLRSRVMERVDAESRRWNWWKPALDFALVAALLFVFFWPKPATIPAVAKRTAAQRAVAVPAHEHINSPRFAVRTRPRRHRRQPVIRASAPAHPAPTGEPMVVKLLTNDPNVVIYWITDTKGDY